MIKNKQYYDIKFPFTVNNLDGFFIDLNETYNDKVLSDLLHVVLTPKRTRIRMPEFGTDLIKYVFEINDEELWKNIYNEICTSVKNYVNGCEIKNIDILREDDDDTKIYVKIDYNVKKGNIIENYNAVVKL